MPHCGVLCHFSDTLQRHTYIGTCGSGMTTLFDICSLLHNDMPSTTSKIIIGGNHGTLFETLGTNKVKELLQTQGGGALYIHNEAVVVEKLVFYGSPWYPLGTTGNNAFQRNCYAYDEVILTQKRMATYCKLDHQENKETTLQ
jgi:hypothetical protein